MSTRRTHARSPRPNARSTVASHRLLSSHTFTLIASWRGQLLICTVVLVVGAIYFVVREPIRQWRRRQRERISRAFTDELLAEEQFQSATSVEEKDPAGPSTGTSTSIAKTLTARERGRERRKEKKQRLIAAGATSPGPSNSVSSLDSSPTLPPVTHALERVPSKLQDSPLLPVAEVTPAPVESTSVPTVNLASSPSSPSQTPMSLSPAPPSPAAQHHSTMLSPAPLTVAELEQSSDHGEASDRPPSDLSRPSVSRTTSASYSIIPEDLYLPLTALGKKKKRKSKARSNGPQMELAKDSPPPLPRNLTMSSDDVPSPSSGTSSITPHTPRRRRNTSGLGGITMTPALELLLTNHERTIDSLRAEIGQSKAEESKAREDEVRAREELRRSRATEDRIRADYERTRKGRDRAESDSRRLEAEVCFLQQPHGTWYD